MPNSGAQAGLHTPKKPVQKRSQERVARILAAAEELLKDEGAPGVTAHAVADKAEVPPSSVYQFFPSREAILFALAQSFIDRVQPYYDKEMSKATIRQWQDIIETMTRVGQKFYRDIPYAAPLIIGSYRTTDIYATDKSYNEQLAGQAIETFRQHFELPPIEDIETKFLIMIEIADAIWAISVRAHGLITDQYNLEARRGMISYLSNYLPPALPPKSSPAS
ncbi:TetR/AcrR family transcriptional regulator [Emcibacter sp.]|uniref:TetR/AcrR family transcriptional regulator n=1 Tax=Emcibacter sp. TaxID=1979954 RepID=UPI003A947B46